MTEAMPGWARELRLLATELEELARLLEGEGPGEDPPTGSASPQETIERALPLLEGHQARLADLASRLRTGRETGSRPRVLVVDDDEDGVSLLSAFLGRYGEVSVARSGEEGAALATKAIRSGRHFSLVFLDYQMPDMDGLETLRRIRGLEEVYSVRVPAIVAMTTASGERDIVMESKEAGSEAYFVKPLDLDRLGSWVEKLGLGQGKGA
jgi:CheY-like chemotaxis protein